MRKTITILLTCFASVVNGQNFSQPVEYEKPVLHDLQPVRTPNHRWNTLNDLEQHMPTQHHFRSDNLITWSHETLHGLDAEIENRYRYRNSGCYYVGKNKFVVLPKTRLTLTGLRDKIPSNIERDTRDIFYTYFGNSTWDNAEYIIEEANAYQMGCVMRAELPVTDREYESEVLFANMFGIYMMYLAEYETNPEILSFIQYSLIRIKKLTWKNRPTPDTDEYLIKVRTSDGYRHIREAMREKFGQDWCRTYLEFN